MIINSTPSRDLSFIVSSSSLIRKSDRYVYDLGEEEIVCSKASGESITIRRNHDELIHFYILSELQDSSKTYAELKSASRPVQASVEMLLLAIFALLELELIVINSVDAENWEHEIDAERHKWLIENFSYYERPGLSKAMMLRRLRVAKVCIIGVGGLGSIVSHLLTASSVLDITLVDGDKVEISNLPRQIFFTPADVGQPKVAVMKSVLEAHEPQAKINCINDFILNEESAVSITKNFDLVILCADEPRLLIHTWIGEASLKNNVPYIAMGSNWVGPVSVPYASPCYICQARFHRAKMSDYDSFVKTTIETPIPPRAAFGPGPALVGAMISAMAIEFLSGIERESHTFNRYQYNIWSDAKKEKLVRYKNCSRCQQDG